MHARSAELIYDGKAPEVEQAMRRHLEAFIEVVDSQGRLDSLAVARSYWQGRLGMAVFGRVAG